MTAFRLARRGLLATALAAALATGLPIGARAAELDIETINAMDQATFVETFGGIFEKSPWVAFAPITVLFLTVAALNFAGDKVRAHFDVRESAL